MQKKWKQFLSLTLAVCLSAVSAGMLTACGGDSQHGSNGQNGYDEEKSHLYAFVYDGGWGTEWTEKIKEGFEKEYADYSFEEGKKGVQVHIYKEKKALSADMRTDTNQIYFTGEIDYNDLASNKLLLPITDFVRAESTDGSGSIESRMSEYQKDAYTALDGNYYCIPFIEQGNGVTYDADLFDRKGYYLKSKEDGSWAGATEKDISAAYFTKNAEEKTVGPDGIRGTYDDGLPSTVTEFKALIGTIAAKGDAPFIWSGQNNWYPTLFGEAVWANIGGADQTMLTYNFGTGNGKDVQLDYVTGFDSNDKPIVEPTTITGETGWKTSQTEGLYASLDLLQYALSNPNYRAAQWKSVNTHMETQRYFIYSDIDPQSEQSIAMIIEGNWWYNEAKQSFEDSVAKFGKDAENRNFKWMPMPVKYDGGVAEGQGKAQTIFGGYQMCAVNANIQDNPAALDMVGKLIEYLYRNANLELVQTTTGGPIGLKYELSEEAYNSMNNYAKSYYDVRKDAEFVNSGSSHPLYLNNSSEMTDARTWLFTSTVEGNQLNPFGAFSARDYSAKDFFLGLNKKDVWNKYSAWFE